MMNCASVAFAGDVTPELLKEKLVSLSDCAAVICADKGSKGVGSSVDLDGVIVPVLLVLFCLFTGQNEGGDILGQSLDHGLLLLIGTARPRWTRCPSCG